MAWCACERPSTLKPQCHIRASRHPLHTSHHEPIACHAFTRAGGLAIHAVKPPVLPRAPGAPPCPLILEPNSTVQTVHVGGVYPPISLLSAEWCLTERAFPLSTPLSLSPLRCVQGGKGNRASNGKVHACVRESSFAPTGCSRGLGYKQATALGGSIIDLASR
jgi:hypothetical protein